MRLQNIPESQVIKIWRQRLLRQSRFATDDGEVEIVYPGRRNDDRGADFRDAVIASSQGRTRGHIEIHAASSDWQAHRHHLDPAYNQVVLHVAQSHNAKTNTILQNGKCVPVVALDKSASKKHPERLSDEHISRPCIQAAKNRRKTVVAEYLDRAGDLRFQAKADGFQTELAPAEADQCLYAGIMGALGYTKNKLPFLELACRAPLRLLQSAVQEARSEGEYVSRVQALLLGTAGLLPSQRPDGHHSDYWSDRLEGLWADLPQPPAMCYSDWHLFKVRPGNFPVRRIAAMSHLMYRYRERCLVEQIVALVRGAGDSKDHHGLEKALMVTGSDYWASHFDFASGGQPVSPLLLGNERAAVTVVNVLLPFTFAWSKMKALPELGAKTAELYRHYPRLSLNAVDRHMMEQLKLSSAEVNSARRQQGLIHIYNTLCTRGKCDQCCLKRPLTRACARS